MRWSGVPPSAKELALLVEDPDAPRGAFLHWAVYGMSPRVTGLAAGALPIGARQGRSDGGEPGYGPPCPPRGNPPHRYVFTLYALRERLRAPAGAAGDVVRPEIHRNAIAEARLVARYGR